MPEKVTNPSKQVIDIILLSHLADQGIDKDYVEFTQDYAMPSIVNGKREKGKSPYAKFYRDLNSNKRFMVVSGLPMVDADGIKFECCWQVAGINYFIGKNNLFRSKVQGASIELICRNDQPDGRKANDKLTYKPQLFINAIEQSCGAPSLLPIDPVNPNYLENTLEWDYGICKRRLRIIEGSIYGNWIFSSNPNGEVRIKYNQTGDYKLKLGQFKINDDEEVIPTSIFTSAIYPFAISDSATYYPDADPETTSVDGKVAQSIISTGTWAEIRDGAGDNSSDTDISASFIGVASTTSNRWSQIVRGIFLFDTSGLPDDVNITAATLSLYGSNKVTISSWTLNINVYSSAPASNTALAAGDYDSLGATAFSDTSITYANWSITGYNDFALNASGIAAISKTGVSKLGARNADHDVANSAPTWEDQKYTYLYTYMSEKGEGYKPKLVVTYTAPTNWEKSLSDSMTLADSPVKLPALTKSDTISLADVLVKLAELGKADSVTLADDFSRIAEFYRTNNDTISLSDTLAKLASLEKADSLSLSDAISTILAFGILLADSLSLSDSLAKLSSLAKADSVTLTDSLAKLISLAKLDTLALTDSITKLASLSKTDSLILTDAIISIVFDRILFLAGMAKQPLDITSLVKQPLEVTSAIKHPLEIGSTIRQPLEITSEVWGE